MKLILTISPIVIILFFSACEKSEIPIKSFDRGDLTVTSVDMNTDYRYQIFFKLNTNNIVKTLLKTEWDIAFDCSSEYHIFLNSSKSMFISKTNKKNFLMVNDTSGFGQNKKWDQSSGNLDSTGFGNIAIDSFIYIIDRGYNELGSHLGFKKLQLISIDDDEYKIRYANLNGMNEEVRSIKKNSDYNTIGFSFETNTNIEIEPQKNDYDLIFTQYTHTFYEPYQPYLVTGVLGNRNKVRVAIEKIKKFDNISITDTSSYTFNYNLDKIGYDWKSFNLNTNTYTVNSEITYIIKDTEGFYYKLHFIDFYNNEGKRGCPKFEYQKL